MSLEFGILLEGSTITLERNHRLDVDEELFDELRPLFMSIEAATGVSLDKYEGAAFSGESLVSFIEKVEAAPQSLAAGHAAVFLADLLRVARVAQASGRALSYMGL
jgi:hypothetical protein